MGLGGFYGGGFYGGMLHVVMINFIIFRLTHIMSLVKDIFFVTLLRRGPLHPETTAHVRADSDQRDHEDPLRSIAEDIRGSLTSWPFLSTAEDFDSRGCAVCLSEFETGESVFKLPHCFHIFHKGCLGKWLDCHQTTCPLCRSSVLTEELSKKLRDQEGEFADASWCGNYAY